MNSRNRSFFWPIVLIGVGVVWLLANLGFLRGLAWTSIWRLWPILLIAVGLDLIFGRHSPWLGALVGAAALALVIAVLYLQPSVLSKPSQEIVESHFLEAVDGAESAWMHINFSVGASSISAAQDEDTLVEAFLTHVGDVQFQVSGEAERRITLEQEDVEFDVQPFDFMDVSRDLRWQIFINENLPTDLVVEGGVGHTMLDLSQIELTSLSMEVGVGDVDLVLPTSEETYEAKVKGGVGKVGIQVRPAAQVDLDIEGGVGSIDIDIEEAADVDAYIRGGVGKLTLELPQNAAVRLEADADLGRIRLPSWMTSVSRDPSEGGWSVWETAAYETAEKRILIRYEGGLGSLTIQ